MEDSEIKVSPDLDLKTDIRGDLGDLNPDPDPDQAQVPDTEEADTMIMLSNINLIGSADFVIIETLLIELSVTNVINQRNRLNFKVLSRTIKAPTMIKVIVIRTMIVIEIQAETTEIIIIITKIVITVIEKEAISEVAVEEIIHLRLNLMKK